MIKKYCESEINVIGIPLHIIDCFYYFETLPDKSNFIKNLLQSNNNQILLYCSIKYNGIISYLEEKNDKFPLFEPIFSIEIINTFFTLINNNNFIPLQVNFTLN